MKVWYDVSGIYHWKGNFTGIQRVVYSLGKELNKSKMATGFFIFHHGAFKPISFEEIEQRLEARVSEEELANEGKIRLGAAYHHFMVGLKRAVIDSPLERPLRIVYGQIRGMKELAASRTSPDAAAPKNTIFKADDIVIVVDGNWQFGGFARSIIEARKRTGFKLVHFVHDLTAVKNPALASRGAEKIIGNYFRKLLPAVDLIIADSEFTKRDTEWFIKKEGIEERPVKVLILGDNISAKPHMTSKRPAASLPDQFILAVSTIEIRKNYGVLYYTYKLAHQRDVSLPHLVIVGRKGWMAEEVYVLLTEDPEIKDEVTILQNIRDEELEWLYKNCLFTVFPSFYEGWGLPVGESFSYGKVCVSSNTSSMPEVGKDLAIYVSPYDTHEIMNTISQLTSNNKKLAEVEKKIIANYAARSWAASYGDMVSLIESAFGVKT